MAKTAKIHTAIRLHPDTLEKINAICDETHVSRTSIIQLAISEYLANQKRQANRLQDTHPEYSTK